VLDTDGKMPITAGAAILDLLASASATADRNQPLPQTLGRASVTMNGVPATLSSVAATRIMGVVPAGMAPGSVKVIVSVNGAPSVPLVVSMK
jgi:uncharacterized protein (TIGR03437 family)